MVNVKAGLVISMTIALLLVGILLPIGLSDIVDYNGTYYYANGSVAGTNTTIATLVGTVIPIMAVISIILMFVSNRNR